MARVHDWPQRLDAAVREASERAFAWGAHDCCRFAAGVAQAITGVDLMHGYRYATEQEARRLIAAGGSLEALVAERLGAPLPSVAQARRGDIVLADLDNGPTLGVCLGRTAAYATEVGIITVPTHIARLAWRVG